MLSNGFLILLLLFFFFSRDNSTTTKESVKEECFVNTTVLRFEEEEINKREKRENHAQHNTNINDVVKVLKMRVLFF